MCRRGGARRCNERRCNPFLALRHPFYGSARNASGNAFQLLSSGTELGCGDHLSHRADNPTVIVWFAEEPPLYWQDFVTQVVMA